MSSNVETAAESESFETGRDPPGSFRGIDRFSASIIGLALLLIALGIWYFFGAAQDADEPAPVTAALAVTPVRPARATWDDAIIVQGVIAPWEEASIGTQIGSYQLIDIRVNVGDRVRRGEVLARLNPALLKAEEAELIAREEQAAANDRRAKALQAAGGISEQDVLQFATEARTSAALLSAKRLELRYTSIVAPDDGVITARTATLGAVMPAGQELFRMIRKNRLEWRGELTAEQLRAIVPGQPITLSLPGGSEARAVVRQTAPALDAESRLAIVYADIESGGPARAGMYVTGTIAVGSSPALAVPAECVVLRDGRNYVVEIVGAGVTPKVVLRAVTVGRRNGQAVEIKRGLSGGERLVRRGGAFLNNGDVVRLADTRKARP